jgi:hypothetical protein
MADEADGGKMCYGIKFQRSNRGGQLRRISQVHVRRDNLMARSCT